MVQNPKPKVNLEEMSQEESLAILARILRDLEKIGATNG